jgi:hypothetical protein
VDENAEIARRFVPFDDKKMRELEGRTREDAGAIGYFKRP